MVAAESPPAAKNLNGNRFIASTLGALLIASLLIFIAGGVSKPMPVGFLTHPELVCLVLIFFASLPAAGRVASIFSLGPMLKSERLLSFAWLAYMSLFLTSCLLCQRLHVGAFHTRRTELGYSGDVLLIAALYIIYAKPSLVAYPRALGLLVALAGVSLAHLAWFPLTALPGMLVLLAWQIGRAQRLQLVEDAVSTPEDGAGQHFETLDTPEKRAFLVKPNEANISTDGGAGKNIETLAIGSDSVSSTSEPVSGRYKIFPFIY